VSTGREARRRLGTREEGAGRLRRGHDHEVDRMSIGTAEAATATKASAPSPFARQSSGLVKTGTPLRTAAMVIFNNGLGVFMAFFYLANPGVFPHTNLVLAFVIAGVLATSFNTLYGLLAGAYARSGGEYLYCSRTLNPLLGFIAGTASFWLGIFFTCFVPYLAFQQAIAPALKAYAAQTGAHWALSAGNWIAVPWHAFWITTAAMAGFTVLMSFGLNAYWKFQRVVIVFGGLAMLLLIGLMLFSSHAAFVHGVNHYGAVHGFKNAYNSTLTAAAAHGLPHGKTLYDTLGMLPICLTTFVLAGYIGGELRTPRKTQLATTLGGSTFFYILLIVIALLIEKTVSLHWNTSAAFLATQHAANYGFDQSPIYTWYAFLLTSSPILLLLMGAGIAIMGLSNGPQQLLWGSRILFAWSLDRVVPAKVAWVWERTASPVIALVITALCGELVLWLYVRGTLTYFAPIIIFGIDYTIVAVCAILIPFLGKTKTFWERSGNNYKLGRVPVITILGVVSLLYWGYVVYRGMKDDLLGANTHNNIVLSLGVIGVGILYFCGVWLYRKWEGMDLSRTYAQLPPD
jgi:amino acid transporter